MSTAQRDARIPPRIENKFNTIHELMDRRLDANFEAVCVMRKGANVIYMLVDVALIGITYRIGNLALLFFTLISLCCCVLHLILIRLLPTSSGRKKRIVGVARMTCYDPAMKNQITNPTPLRRFALLTNASSMPLWHMWMIVEIVAPPTISLLVAFFYFMLTLGNAVFLGVFLAVRVLISLLQYRVLKNFYADAVSDSFESVVVSESSAVRYAISRANGLVNNDLERANDYLRGHRRSSRAHTAKPKKRDSQTSSFSGISLDSMKTEDTPASGIQHL